MEQDDQSIPSAAYPVVALYLLGEENAGAALNFVVIDVKRYQVNQHFIKSINYPTDAADAYDIFLTDGNFITKAVLRPDKNYLIEKHHIYKGCTVSVEGFTRRYDETNRKSLGDFIILTDLNREGDEITLYTEDQIDGLRWYIVERWLDDPENASSMEGMAQEKREKSIKDMLDDLHHVPLISGRGTYLHLNANDCGLGIKWSAKDLTRPPQDLQDDIVFDTETDQLVALDILRSDFLSNKSKHVNYWRNKRFHAVIVGRIIRKSRLYNYGKPSDSNENSKWPFKFQFTITDGTQDPIDCVVWNRLCPTFFAGLSVGDVVALRNFRTKTPYVPTNGPAPDEDGYKGDNPATMGDKDLVDAQEESLTQGLIEIALNGGVDLRVIPPDVVSRNDLLKSIPGIPVDVKRPNEIVNLPDKSLCDVCGMVAFCGDIVTTRWKSMYRWVLLRTSIYTPPHNEFWVKVIPNSDAKSFEDIAAGDVIMITNVRVEHHLFSSTSRLIHLHCTTWSTITGDADQLELLAETGKQEGVVQAIQVVRQLASEDQPDQMKRFRAFTNNLGRHFRQHLPPCQGLSHKYRDLYGVPSDQLTFIDDIPQICADLNYGEMKHILIQGYVKQITFVTRKQLYQGEIIGPDQKFKVSPDLTSPTNRELFLLHVENLNREKSVLLTVPVFILLYEGFQGYMESPFDTDTQMKKFHRFLKFLAHSVPALRQLSDQQELIKAKDMRSRLRQLMEILYPKRNAPHQFVFGVTLSRKDHNDVECVVNNVFPKTSSPPSSPVGRKVARNY